MCKSNLKLNITGNNELQISYEIDGSKLEQVIFPYVSEKKYTVGRKTDCDLFLNDTNISRVHMTISCSHNSWYIEDGFEGKASSNGIWMFIQEPIEIENGMKIRLVKSTLEFEYN